MNWTMHYLKSGGISLTSGNSLFHIQLKLQNLRKLVQRRHWVRISSPISVNMFTGKGFRFGICKGDKIQWCLICCAVFQIKTCLGLNYYHFRLRPPIPLTLHSYRFYASKIRCKCHFMSTPKHIQCVIFYTQLAFFGILVLKSNCQSVEIKKVRLKQK